MKQTIGIIGRGNKMEETFLLACQAALPGGDFLVCSTDRTEVTGVPDTIKILPLGLVKTQHGNFTVDDKSFREIENTFKSRGNDIVIDYEHQTLMNVQAPAGGWIKSLSKEDGAIVAKVEWTPQARQYLENKEYRYLSPVVLVRKSDSRAIALNSVALTNTPAIDGMFPIINSMNFNFGGGNDNMDLIKQLAALLGLGEDATQEQVMESLTAVIDDYNKSKEQNGSGSGTQAGDEKVVANKVICELVGLKAGASTEDVAAAILALSKKPEGTVSEADFKALKDKLDTRDANDAVTAALKAGKLTPDQKDWATAYALKDPEGFDGFVKKAPQVVPMGEIDIETKANKGTEALDDTTLAICKMLDVSKEDLDKYGKGDK